MTDVEFEKLMAILIAALPGQWQRMFRGDEKSVQKQEAATSTVYKRMLADLDFVVASAAVERVLASATFFPTPGEIRAAAADLVATSASGGGGEAWGSVRKAMEREGAHRSPGADFVFRDPITARAVDSLGWRALCLSENTTADRARFIELYDLLASSSKTEAQMANLPAAQRLRELQAKRDGAIGAGDAAAQVLRLVGGGES